MELRELLVANSATNSLDEASPLSAPDLHALKVRLHIRSLQTKDRVNKYLRSHYDEFAAIISVASQTAAEVDDLSEKLENALRFLDDSPADRQLCRLASDRTTLKNNIQDKRETLLVLRGISAIRDSLRNVRQLIERRELFESAKALNSLPAFLTSFDDKMGNGDVNESEIFEVKGEPRVLSLLRRERASHFRTLQVLLDNLFDNAVEVDISSSRLCTHFRVPCKKPSEDMDLEFYSVLTVMDMIGILDSAFARLADLLIKYIITPTINISAINIVSTDLDNGRAILCWPLSSDAPRSTIAPGDLYPKLLQILQFIYRHVCFENGSWMTMFGRFIWPRLSETIITNCLSKAVPTEATEVAKFQKVLELTKEFECTLMELSLISTSDDKDSRLSNFAKNIEVHFASKKRNQILARVRQLLVFSDFSSSLENSDLLFQPTSLVLSLAARQLMQIVHEVLQDSCSLTTKVAAEFYQSARDSLLLYRAIVPVKLAKELSTLCQAAIVVHNDCRYIAQEVLALSFEYRPSFPDGSKDIFVFVDLAPLFHQMAERLFDQQIEIALSSLNEALDQANGFQDTHKKQQSEMARLALDQVVLVLEKIRMLWQPVLEPSLYKNVVCSLLDHLFSRISSEILSIDDMAVEETLQLQMMIQATLKNLLPLLVSITNENTGIVDDFSETWWQKFEVLIPTLRKLRQIAELLDMPLKSITRAWENGELAVSGFTAFEVAKLVRAIFSDTPLRKECLRRIDATEFV